MGLLDTWRNMRQQTLLREKQQQGLGGIAGLSPEDARMGFEWAGTAPITRPGFLGSGSYAAAGQSPTFVRPPQAPAPVPLGKSALGPGQASTPLGAGGGGGPRPIPKPSVRPGAGGITGLSVQDFANLHGQEVQTPTLGEAINRKVQDQVYEGDKERAEDTAKVRQDVADFLKGYRGSMDARIAAPYHPALSGWRGTARDFGRGLSGIRDIQLARQASQAKMAVDLAQAAAATKKADASVLTAQAAQQQAETAVDRLKWEAEKQGIEISNERWKALVKFVQGPIEEYIKAQALTLDDPDPEVMNRIVRTQLDLLKQGDFGKIIDSEAGKKAIDTALPSGGASTEEPAKQPMSLQQLKELLDKK